MTTSINAKAQQIVSQTNVNNYRAREGGDIGL